VNTEEKTHLFLSWIFLVSNSYFACMKQLVIQFYQINKNDIYHYNPGI